MFQISKTLKNDYRAEVQKDSIQKSKFRFKTHLFATRGLPALLSLAGNAVVQTQQFHRENGKILDSIRR